MGWRFRRSYRILPGVRIYVTPRGASLSMGPRGANLHVGPGGTHANIGLPGTGLSYRGALESAITANDQGVDALSAPEAAGMFEADTQASSLEVENQTAVISAAADSITSEGFTEFREMLFDVITERERLKLDISYQKTECAKLTAELAHLRGNAVMRALRKARVAELDGLSRQSDLRLKDLEEQLDASRFDLQVECDESIKSAHERVVKVFSSVVTCAAIWDITDYEEIDPTVTRSNAQAAVARRPVHFGFRQPEFIDYAGRVPFMQNANGSDLYFYPGFLLLVSNDATLALVDPTELDVEFVTARTREEEGVPNDALVIGQTWAKENKDGSPDRRFAGNYQIPLVSYGMLKLRSNAGLNEWYLLSDVKKAEDLGEALQQYATSQV